MRKLFRWLPKSRGKRILAITGLGCGGVVLLLIVLGVTGFFLFRNPRVATWFWSRMMHSQVMKPLPDPPATPPGPPFEGGSPSVADLRTARDLYRTTNIWTVHFKLTSEQWTALGPKRVPAMHNFMQPDGAIVLRNPQASRSGIAGVLGFDYLWSQADVEFGGVWLTNVGLRYKGDGTFLAALRSYKRPFKLDLKRHVPDQRLAGRSSLNLNNLGADQSCLSDALAYEFFRDAGVPAPRTAYARVFLSVTPKFDRRLLGLYVLPENLDAEWAEETFGVTNVALFKPVTHELFKDLGDEWKPYDEIYDPKTPLTEAQQRRLIELARFHTRADDAEFAARIGEFIDLDEFARFLACETALSHYDGILAQGQNFFLYLDPRTNKFGFIPWDLDHSWGEFPFFSTADQRERASIWHSWIGANRFLERLMAVEDFKRRYRAVFEQLVGTLFVAERLNQRIDALAAVIRPALAEESPQKLAKFETTIADQWTEGPRDGNPFDENRPPYQLKRFVATRAQNLRDQLEGKLEGVVLTRQPPR
jgi:hypothetical protein